MSNDAPMHPNPTLERLSRKPRLPGLGTHFGFLASPPAVPRILARGRILCAELLRGELETAVERDEARLIAAALREWLDAAGDAGELEPEEQALLAAPVGTLSAGERERCAWLGEGAGVLAWALGRSELPAPGTLVDGSTIAEALALMSPDGTALASRVQLRPRETLLGALEVIELAAARLRQSLDAPAAMSLAHWRAAQFLWPAGVVPFDFVADDLALDGLALAEVPAARRFAAWRGAAERERAARWLLGAAKAYSQSGADAPFEA